MNSKRQIFVNFIIMFILWILIRFDLIRSVWVSGSFAVALWIFIAVVIYQFSAIIREVIRSKKQRTVDYED